MSISKTNVAGMSLRRWESSNSTALTWNVWIPSGIPWAKSLWSGGAGGQGTVYLLGEAQIYYGYLVQVHVPDGWRLPSKGGQWFIGGRWRIDSDVGGGAEKGEVYYWGARFERDAPGDEATALIGHPRLNLSIVVDDDEEVEAFQRFGAPLRGFGVGWHLEDAQLTGGPVLDEVLAVVDGCVS